MASSYENLLEQKKFFTEEENSTPLDLVWGTNMAAVSLFLDTNSIDDGNSSESVSFKMNSRFFSLCRVYSNLLKMASVGEFSWR